jgi:fatty-acid desaturase
MVMTTLSDTSSDHLVGADRVFPVEGTSALGGVVRFQWVKAIWLLINGVGGIVGLVWFMRLDAVLIFLLLTAITVCAGHSVGMHRLLIHRSFSTPRWVEYVLVWLGTLVGMAGPFGMIKAHDMRDWHQLQTICPPHPSHDARFFKDAYWQMCCTFELSSPPRFEIESDVRNDLVYLILDRTWMAQQLFIALPLYLIGGVGWLLWGCCLRVFISLVGHWMVGHFAHKQGAQNWRIKGLPVQGYNLPRLGLVTFGENWHGNHHAFPHSAKLGIERGQVDPGYVLILCLQKIGLAWSIKLPTSEPYRTGLVRIGTFSEADFVNRF